VRLAAGPAVGAGAAPLGRAAGVVLGGPGGKPGGLGPHRAAGTEWGGGPVGAQAGAEVVGWHVRIVAAPPEGG